MPSRSPDPASAAPPGASGSGWSRHRTRLIWLGGLFVATVVFWKLRIIDAATRRDFGLGGIDIYTEHLPMTKVGFARLFAGDLPLWNPYQLTGTPFLPVTHVGLFYPPNFIYAFIDTAVATEISFIAHLFFAGAGMWLLLRSLDFSPRAGLAAALTFMWSGWMIFYSNQASLISGMSWLPFSVWMVELALRGRALAAFGLVGAVALQLFNGATEFFVYNMYVSAAFAAVRLVQIGLAGDVRLAFRRGATLLGCVLAGVLLSTPQLLPSVQLAGESVRGAEPLSFAQARHWGAIRPSDFVRDALMTRDMVTVGVLPLAGLILGVMTRKRWLFGLSLGLVVVAALLVFGGKVYWLYFQTPIGDLFRRPHKFLHIYAFGQAVMAALAVLALEERLDVPARRLLRSPGFAGAIVALLAAAIFVRVGGEWAVALWLLAFGLLGFALAPVGRPRQIVLVAIIALQSVNLFFGVKQDFVRPAARPGVYAAYDTFIEGLRGKLGNRRVYIESSVSLLPGLMQKVGTTHRIRVLGDYSPLSSQRAADYFARVDGSAGSGRNGPPFLGAVLPTGSSDWRLLDMTSTRFYVTRNSSETDAALTDQARRTRETGVVRHGRAFPSVYERTTALPRAYFVGHARFAMSPEHALDLIQAEDFDPRREVVLEAEPSAEDADARRGRVPGRVRIVRDETERVTLEVEASAPGYVVLVDAMRPGWRAWRGDDEVPIEMANGLFRAVRVPAGRSVIDMRYRSRPFERGLWLSGLTLVVLAIVAVRVSRGRGAPAERA